MRTITIAVSGMHCASCGLLIDDTLLDMVGVVSAVTDTRTGLCQVAAEDSVSDLEILNTITEVGYQGAVQDQA